MRVPLRRAGGLRFAGLVGVIGAVALAAFASAAPSATLTRLLPADHLTLSVPSAVARSNCATTRLAGARGTTTVPYSSSSPAALSFVLKGPAGNDWDLAVFDHATGRRLGGSGAFAASELVQALTAAGRRLDVQACRISGSASSLSLTVQRVSLDGIAALAKPPVQSLVRIRAPQLELFGLLDDLGIDLVEDASPTGVTAVLDSPAQLGVLRSAGFGVTTLVPDLAAQDRADRAADATYTRKMRAAGGSPLPSGRTTYRHLEDVQADLKKIVQEHPAIARPVTLPEKTFQGRDTTGVEISGNVNATDDQKPYSWIMGEHHAREWPSEEIPLEFAYYLVQGYGTDKEITKLLDHTRVVIVPVINSDGFVASRETPIDPADVTGDPAGAPSLVEGGDVTGGTLAYRRKNCRGALPASTPCILQYGVDPNRNYGVDWGATGASTNLLSQSYRGPEPFSESETRAVHEYSQAHDVTTLITIHNFASLVMRPPDLQVQGEAPDDAAMKRLGDAMAADTGYTSEKGYELYDTSGTTEDWNYTAAGTYGYTIELGPDNANGGNFHIAYQRGVVDQWTGVGAQAGRGMRAALMSAAEAATDATQFSTVAGRAPAGRALRLTKTFQSSTARVCAIANPLPVLGGGLTDCIAPGEPILFPDKLEYTTTVPANGNFSWLVTPSTRPYVHNDGQSEAWTLTCEDGGAVRDTRQVMIWRGEKQTIDMPCGGKLPKRVAGPKDNLAPKSRITRKSLLATRRGLQVAGTSVDFAPAGFEPSLKTVTVALGRRVGSRCRFATSRGTFGAPVRCTHAHYLRANGTATWTFLYRHRLPPGRYLAWVRAADAAGNHERKEARRNRLLFTVR